MSNSPGNIFGQIKNDLIEYVDIKLAYFKLNGYEGIAKLVAFLSYQLVKILLTLFFFLFIFLSLGLFLGEILKNYALGFFIVAGIYAIIIGLLTYFRSNIQARVKNEIIFSLMNINEDKEVTEAENNTKDNENKAGRS